MLFPTSIREGQSVHEIPFGAIRRPDGIEFPAQNWIDYGDGREGVALLNRGLPGNNVADGTMMLSLLRSTRIVSYGDASGGYGAGSDSSLELNNELLFDYALVPHAGDWRAAGVYRDGMEFNQPLLACPMACASRQTAEAMGTPGDHAAECRRLRAETERRRRGGAASLRSDRPGDDREDSAAGADLAAEEVNLMEDPGRKLPVADNTLQLDFHPFEIKTIKLRLEPNVKHNRAVSGQLSVLAAALIADR